MKPSVVKFAPERISSECKLTPIKAFQRFARAKRKSRQTSAGQTQRHAIHLGKTKRRKKNRRRVNAKEVQHQKTLHRSERNAHAGFFQNRWTLQCFRDDKRSSKSFYFVSTFLSFPGNKIHDTHSRRKKKKLPWKSCTNLYRQSRDPLKFSA